jgi:hypothetical protein
MTDQTSASEKPTQPDAGEMPKILGPDFIVDRMNLYLYSSLQAYGRQCFAAGEAKAGAEVASLKSEVQLLTHKILCCGVAATHPDSTLTTRGAYAEEWASQQADEVRALRADRDALRGLARWASGRLIDAGDAESAQQVLDLAGQGAADDSAATIAGLRRFAQKVMAFWPDGGIDGFDLQDIAGECGMLCSVQATEPCGRDCNCAAECGEWPVECFRKTALLLGDGPAPAVEDIAGLRADAERLEWLDRQAEAYGFEDLHEGNRWLIDGPFPNLRAAIDAARSAQAAAGDS